MPLGSVRGLPSRLASSRAPAAVTVRSMAASRLPARAPWFERISSRLARVAASMTRRLPARLFARRTEQRRFADLGDLHIGEQPGERGKLGPGEFAEGVERGDAEAALQRPLAAYGIEMGARARRKRGACFLDLAAEHGIAGDDRRRPAPRPA